MVGAVACAHTHTNPQIAVVYLKHFPHRSTKQDKAYGRRRGSHFKLEFRGISGFYILALYDATPSE